MAFFPCYPLNESAERSQNRSRFTSEVTKHSYEVASNLLQTVATVTFYFNPNDFNEGPFGELIRSSGTPPCNFGFSTKYRDSETGLNYYGYRYYSSGLGRWMGRDPIGERGGKNLYAFCKNNGVNRIDKYGLASGYSLGWDWLNQKEDKKEITFSDGESLTEEVKNGFLGESVKQKMLNYGRIYCKGAYPAPIQLGNELTAIPWYKYPFKFAAWLYTSPSTAFIGSFSGGGVTVQSVECDCKVKVKGRVNAINSSNWESAIRFPPGLGGYDGNGSVQSKASNASDSAFPTPFDLFPSSSLLSKGKELIININFNLEAEGSHE